MKKVTILGCYNTMASTVTGPMDIFNQAGRLWNRLNRTLQEPSFEVTLVSADGNAIQAANNVSIQPHCSIRDIEKTDLIVISSATYIEKILEQSPDLPDVLKEHYEKGAHIASICTGVFLLAETGLLHGKTATLHWGFEKMFHQKYPHITLDTERMYIDHGRLYCSAGSNAGLDLSLYLIEKFCGRKAAVESAKTMVLDLGRTKQTPYGSFLDSGDHSDPVILEIEKKIQADHVGPIDYDTLADTYRISRRSLERRFKQATGMTLLAYVQQLRVETAKKMLEEGRHTFNEITYKVGYEDISFFRKIFTRLTGLRPMEYQKKFAGFGSSFQKEKYLTS